MADAGPTRPLQLQDKAFRTGIRKTDLDVGTLPPKSDARQCLGESQRLREAPRVGHHVQELAHHLRREGKMPQTRSTRFLHGKRAAPRGQQLPTTRKPPARWCPNRSRKKVLQQIRSGRPRCKDRTHGSWRRGLTERSTRRLHSLAVKIHRLTDQIGGGPSLFFRSLLKVTIGRLVQMNRDSFHMSQHML